MTVGELITELQKYPEALTIEIRGTMSRFWIQNFIEDPDNQLLWVYLGRPGPGGS